ncbi:NAD kinase-like [Oscarella lobularis]|uniref:NAD kinase-like n=1 Tax=Oscarella lobularis TaxID=121494 RepID=UPI003313C9FF
MSDRNEAGDAETKAESSRQRTEKLLATDRFGPKACLREAESDAMNGSCHAAEANVHRPLGYHVKWTQKPKSVLVIKKFRDRTVTCCFKKLISWLHDEKNMSVYVESSVLDEEELADDQKFQKHCERLHTWIHGEDELKDKIDFIVCLGGDGTLLYASSLFPSSVPPLIGFHLGSLGFLTPFSFDSYDKTISSVIDGDARLTLRLRLHCLVKSDVAPRHRKQYFIQKRSESFSQAAPVVKQLTASKKEALVLNELVIDRGPSPYLSNLNVYLNDNLVTVVQGDGLIVATPTGSTAYSAAAGSSMVHPSVPAIILAPICPHSLSFRPILVPSGVSIKICVADDSRHTAWASFDGRNRQEIKQGDSILVTSSKWPLPCVTKGDHLTDWFRSLSECLNWNYRLRQKSLDDEASKESCLKVPEN